MLSTYMQFNSEAYFFLKEIIPLDDIKFEKNPTPTDRLNAIEIVYRQAFMGCNEFITGKLKAFDPSPGDQACQNRALWFAWLYKSCKGLSEVSECSLIFQERLARIEQARAQLAENEKKTKEKISTAISEYEKDPSAETNGKIKAKMDEEIRRVQKGADFGKKRAAIVESYALQFKEVKKKMESIKRNHEEQNLLDCYSIVSNPDLDCRISESVIAIVRAYLITKCKKEEKSSLQDGSIHYKDSTYPPNLKIEGIAFPGNLFERIVPVVKRMLIKQTYQFMQSQASLLSQERDILYSIAAKPLFIEKKKQHELPCFYAYRIVFLRAMEEQVPIILKVRNRMDDPTVSSSFICKLMLKPDLEKRDFYISGIDPEDITKPAIVIEAVSNQENSMLKSSAYPELMMKEGGSFMTYSDWFFASHGQYTDQEETSEDMYAAIPDIEKSEIEKLVMMKRQAEIKGFAKQNRTICGFEHIYTDLVGNQLDDGRSDRCREPRL